MNDPGEWLKCLFAHVVVLVRGQSAVLSTNYPEVIVISSDSEKEKKASGGKRASRRAPIQTLTSILTKCSRV
jgi:hypothetical protein